MLRNVWKYVHIPRRKSEVVLGGKRDHTRGDNKQHAYICLISTLLLFFSMDNPSKDKQFVSGQSVM